MALASFNPAYLRADAAPIEGRPISRPRLSAVCRPGRRPAANRLGRNRRTRPTDPSPECGRTGRRGSPRVGEFQGPVDVDGGHARGVGNLVLGQGKPETVRPALADALAGRSFAKEMSNPADGVPPPHAHDPLRQDGGVNHAVAPERFAHGGIPGSSGSEGVMRNLQDLELDGVVCRPRLSALSASRSKAAAKLFLCHSLWRPYVA